MQPCTLEAVAQFTHVSGRLTSETIPPSYGHATPQSLLIARLLIDSQEMV